MERNPGKKYCANRKFNFLIIGLLFSAALPGCCGPSWSPQYVDVEPLVKAPNPENITNITDVFDPKIFDHVESNDGHILRGRINGLDITILLKTSIDEAMNMFMELECIGFGQDPEIKTGDGKDNRYCVTLVDHPHYGPYQLCAPEPWYCSAVAFQKGRLLIRIDELNSESATSRNKDAIIKLLAEQLENYSKR